MRSPSLTERVKDTLALTYLRLTGHKRPPVASVPDPSKTSLFIGPTNSAGQAYAWARSAETVTQTITATSMVFSRTGDRFRFPIDQSVDERYSAHSSSWQRQQFAAVSRYDAVILESGIPLFRKLYNADTAEQVRQLRDAGTKVALLFHGSDIRDPDTHMAEEALSHFTDDPALTDALRNTTTKNRALVDKTGASVFVSTAGLLTEIPGATWLPVVVDPARWNTGTQALTHSARPVVAFAPSGARLKGAHLVDPTLTRLHEEGVIEYRPVRGIPHAEMPRVYREADIVLDQFRVGDYGVAACEALAAGRLVLSHIPERIRAAVSRRLQEDVPIVQATPDTLADVLIDITRNPDHYASIARNGPSFVKRHHSGHTSGRIIAEWMETQ